MRRSHIQNRTECDWAEQNVIGCDTLAITATGHMRVQPQLLIYRCNNTLISYYYHYTINGDTLVPIPYMILDLLFCCLFNYRVTTNNTQLVDWLTLISLFGLNTTEKEIVNFRNKD